MDKLPLISVIIPVYNVIEYLDECIVSVINQSYTNLEIIIVDDGSTDGSGKKCDEWQEKDERIIVIHQENGGLSNARNSGIKKATGELLAFVDSDDYVDIYMYEQLYRGISLYDADIACCDFMIVYDCIRGEACNSKKYVEKVELLSSMEAISRLFDDDSYKFYAWNKIYKHKLFDGICYPDGKICEDIWTTYRLFDSSSKIAVLSNKLYYYREREKSITRSGFFTANSSMFDLRDASDFVFDDIGRKYNSITKKVVAGYICYYFRYVTRAYLDNIDVDEDAKKLKKIIKKYFFPFFSSKHISATKKIQAFMFLIFTREIYVCLYDRAKKITK